MEKTTASNGGAYMQQHGGLGAENPAAEGRETGRGVELRAEQLAGGGVDGDHHIFGAFAPQQAPAVIRKPADRVVEAPAQSLAESPEDGGLAAAAMDDLAAGLQRDLPDVAQRL